MPYYIISISFQLIKARRHCKVLKFSSVCSKCITFSQAIYRPVPRRGRSRPNMQLCWTFKVQRNQSTPCVSARARVCVGVFMCTSMFPWVLLCWHDTCMLLIRWVVDTCNYMQVSLIQYYTHRWAYTHSHSCIYAWGHPCLTHVCVA